MRDGVTFWTEAGSSIGMGHLVRCVALAKALMRSGVSVHFLINGDPSAADLLRREGMYFLTCPFERTNAGRLVSDVAVIDTKKDVSAHVASLKESGKKVLLIDNFSNSDLADGVILPYASVKARPSGPGVFSGAEYVIVGEKIIKEREAVKKLPYSIPLQVLVTMGGADPNNLTELVLEDLCGLNDIEITVVIGPASRNAEVLRKYEGRGTKIKFLENVRNMAAVISKAHIAFTAVGMTIYELAFMGVPSVLIANYREDKGDLEELDAMGISLSLGYFGELEPGSVKSAVRLFLDNRSRWERMSKTGQNLIDGLGAVRVSKVIQGLL